MASNVGVIISIAPFFTVIFARLFLKESRPNARFLLGFAIAIIGTSIISGSGGAYLRINPLGNVLAVVASVTWSAYPTISKKIADFGINTIQTTRHTFFYGFAFMEPVLFLMEFHVIMMELSSPTMVLNLLFWGLGTSALCFVTWNVAEKALGSVRTSVYIYMAPFITAITSALILYDEMARATICGIALTLRGLFLSEIRNQEMEERSNEEWGD